MSETSAMPVPGDWDYRPFAPVPFARFRAELLKLYEPPLRARATYRRMKQTLDLVVTLVGPDGTTADLNPTLLARLIDSRAGQEHPRTTHTTLAYLRSACSYAKSQGYIRTTPWEFRRKWIKPGPIREGQHHSREDIRRVLDLLASEVQASEGWPRWRARRLLAVVSLFAYTGLRRDEGLRLHVEDIDLERRMIFLVERKGRHFKTEASAQPVPIADALAPLLADWLAHRLDAETGRSIRGRWTVAADCPFLFPNVSRTNTWQAGPTGHKPLDQLKAAGERAGVPGFTFLSLRHSFATHAEAWGLSPAMLQRVLRHTSLGTQKHYRHADIDNMRSAVDGIDFGPSAGPETEGGPSS